MQVFFWIIGNATLIRILEGDSIWFALGGCGALAGWLAAGLLSNKWARVIIGLLLAAACVYAVHGGYELFMQWYTTPLGAPLQGL